MLGEDHGAGILDTLVVAPEEGAHPGSGEPESPGEPLGELQRSLENRRDWQAVDGQDGGLRGSGRGCPARGCRT